MTSPTARRPAVPLHRSKPLRLNRHHDAPDPADLGAVRAWVKSRTRPTAVDLFAGAGGLSFGLTRAGFDVLVSADSDEWAVETHSANVGGLGWCGDLSEPATFLEHLEGWGIDRVDVLVGGVPCQPFSRAGQSKIRDLVRAGARAAEDPRVELWRSFMTVVRRLRPRMVLVENVPDLPRWDEGAVLIDLVESLRAEGYEVDAQVIDCFAFGVPQHRARLILVGHNPEIPFAWPQPTGEFTTLRDAIGDLPIVPGGQRERRLSYRPRRALTPFQEAMRAGMPDEARNLVFDHITRAVRDDDMEAFEHLGEGQTYADVPERLRRYRSDIFTDKYKRLSWNELSRTITAHLAKDGYWYIHPEQNRTLSIREAARIQTFPDHFRFAGQQSHQYRQIGNAVPPMLGEALGRQMIKGLAVRQGPERCRPAALAARESLLSWHADHRRPLPWRAGGAHPWHVLIAELCLQRARAEDAEEMWRRLTALVETPMDVRELSSDEIAARLRPLGMSQRAETIRDAAAAINDLFDGEVPDTDFELRMIPAVGDYAAQATLCFGFGRRAVLLDQTTIRITSRLYGRDTSRRWQLRLDLHRLAGADGPDPAFNAALLDLGALICRPEQPRCGDCPLREHCATGSGAPAPDQLTLVEPTADV